VDLKKHRLFERRVREAYRVQRAPNARQLADILCGAIAAREEP
jgi:hypothetical protein